MSGTGIQCSGSSVCTQSPFPKTAQNTGRCLSFSFKIAACLVGRREGFLLFCATLDSWVRIIPAIFRLRAPGFFLLVQFLLSLSAAGKQLLVLSKNLSSLLMTTVASMEHPIGKSEGARHCVEFSLRKYTALEVLLFYQLNPLIPI